MILRVGVDQKYKTIAAALEVTTNGTEILVDVGVYREPLFIQKAVTIRSLVAKDDFTAIQSLEGDDNDTSGATIHVTGCFSVVCDTPVKGAIRIIGFCIICDAPDMFSFHAVLVSAGVVVIHNCSLSSSSGPVVATEHEGTKLIMQTCAIHSGAQGGILTATNSCLSTRQIHCCKNAACGMELREGGCAVLDDVVSTAMAIRVS